MTVILCAALPADLLDRVQATHTVIQVPPGAPLQDAVPAERRGEVRGILCTIRTRIDAAILDAFPSLRVVSNQAVGHDNVHLPALDARGVLLCNTPGVLDAAVADLTFALLICLGRNVVPMHDFVRSGAWSRESAPLASDLAGKRLGLLGMGGIGRMVAQRARAFGMDVAYHNRNRDAASESSGLASYLGRDQLFAESDFVSVHVPLSPETRGSVGAREFDLMKRGAYFINTSRGAVVDEPALVRALQERRIAGAGLDVMLHEPLDPAHPFCSLPNVVLQPHAGSATVETRRAMIDLATENLLRALRGEPPQALVNPGAWSTRGQQVQA